jgi:hypothetical protein
VSTNFTRTSTSLAALAGMALVFTTAVQALPARVDLRSQQTPLRDQGDRNTCQTFGATAALEAAYKRAGFGELNLSEQFLNHVGKTFWLHGNFADIVVLGADGAEGQVGVFGGGGGAPYIRQLTGNLRTIAESLMPYRPTPYTGADHPHLDYPHYDDFWKKQRNQSDVNLDPRFLPRAAVRPPLTYAVQRSRVIDARSAVAIETELAAGREVVWDFLVARTAPALWLPCPDPSDECVSGAHSMLIVGYDRTHRDPAQHYFIAKNSWGPGGARSDGFTYLSYGYLRYGLGAAVIDAVATPAAWPELANVGRWSLNFDGFRGSFDIHHIPGVANIQLGLVGSTLRDTRVGTFYDSSGASYRSNGSMRGNRLTFNIDWARPMPDYDDVLGGRQFDYFRLDSAALGEVMAGSHRDPDGREYGGYLRHGGFLRAGAATPRPFAAASWVRSSWSLHFQMRDGTLTIDREDQSVLPAQQRATHVGMRGTWTRPGIGAAMPVTLAMSRSNPGEVTLQMSDIGLRGSIKLRHLSHEPGVAAGSGVDDSGNRYGALMIRR